MCEGEKFPEAEANEKKSTSIFTAVEDRGNAADAGV